MLLTNELLFSSKYTENVLELKGYCILFEDDIYVFEDEKTYLLKENESSWVATEVENFNPFRSEQVLLDDLNYTDFTYDEETKSYIYSKDNDTVIYRVTFKNDVLVYYSIETILDPLNPDDKTLISYGISDIVTTEIDVPDYTK